MNEVNNGSPENNIPTPAEAAEREVIDLSGHKLSAAGEMVEDYLIDNLSEDYADEELNEAVAGFVAEALDDMELARLIVRRERKIAQSQHPMFKSSNQEKYQQQLDEINQEIAARKFELQQSDSS